MNDHTVETFNKTQTDSSHIINVIDEYDYSTQQEDYNKHFIAWRKNKDNPYAYNLSIDKKESIYIVGQGFIDTSVSDAELTILSRILKVIGVAILTLLIIEDVFDKLFVALLDLLGVDIHCSISSALIYGGRTEVVVTLIFITLIKFTVPLAIVNKKFKMPKQIRRPCQLRDISELISAICVTMMLSVIASYAFGFLEEMKGIYSFFLGHNADVSVWNQTEFIAYAFVDIVVLSVATELLFRGAMLTALRQFGDVYAIIITSVLTGLSSQNLTSMFGVMGISAVCAIGTLRSGSIMTAVFTRMSYKIYLLTLTIIDSKCTENIELIRNLYMLTVFVISAVLFLALFITKERRKRPFFAKHKKHTSMRCKLICTIRTVPIAAFIAISLFVAVYERVF